MIPSEDDIQIIIAGCITNDRKSQEELYKRFYQAMMGLCVRYTRDKNDALEVLNDGFLKVFKNIARYDPQKGSVYTWIRRIIIHAAIDFLRKKQQLSYKDTLPYQEEETGIENEAIRKLGGEELLRMIRQLQPATRLVFNLYRIDGFSHREIAGMLQISEGTSRWHLSEARRQLKLTIQILESNK